MAQPTTPEDLFTNSVRCLLDLAVDQLNVKFAIARVIGEPPIANDPSAPLEAEAAIVEPVMDSSGRARGSISVIGDLFHPFTASHRRALTAIAEVIANSLELLDVARASSAQERLRDREEYFRVLTDNATDIIFIIGPDGILTYMSASLETVLGYKVEERLGKPAFETVHPEDRDRLLSLINIFRSGRSLDRAQFRFRHKNGSWRLLEIHGTNLLQHPLIGGLVITARDVTERRRLEQELEQLNRLSSLGRLAAQVAHEFNNVMMGIQPAVDILRRIGADNPQIGRLTDMIGSSISRGKRITSDILRFGRPAQLSLRSLDVQELIERSAMEIRSLLPSGVTLTTVKAERPLHVRGDHPQLVQVLINLALNARDAMAENGGTLTIRAYAGAGDQFVHIDVADTGEGIRGEDLPHIFEPMFTTKRTGTGLGLSVIYQVVTAHGGHIFVDTKRGVGTTFHLSIPCDVGVREVEHGQHDAPADLQRVRVLIVEDEITIATGLRWILEAEGMVVHAIGRAAEVLPAVDEFQPDVVLLDLSLPDNDGRTVYEAISRKSVPVIFSTGSVGARDLVESGHGGVSVLRKPYTSDDLLRAIYEIVQPGEVQ